MIEEWHDVVGFEGLYLVSNFGRIKTVKTGRIKTLTIDKSDGRPFLFLWKNNIYKSVRPHRVVLQAFVGQCPAGMEGCHNDGNPKNNHIDNLRWGTPSSNQMDRARHGTSNRGERCAAAKLTEAQAKAIIFDPRLHREIAADYGVRQSMISRIKSGKRWVHLHTP